jgi:hypothetical protein
MQLLLKSDSFLLKLKRLKKLGINKTDPDSLTRDEQKAFARLNIDVNTITWHRGESRFYFLFYFIIPTQLQRSYSIEEVDELGRSSYD